MYLVAFSRGSSILKRLLKWIYFKCSNIFLKPMSASHLSRLASHTVDSIDLKESTLEKRNSSNQQELLRVQVVPENDSERPLSPKGHRGGSASMEELKVFLDEAHLNLKSMQPKKLRALRYGEELRDLLSRVMSELELHSDRIEANLDKPGVASCVTKLRSTVSKAQPLIKRCVLLCKKNIEL